MENNMEEKEIDLRVYLNAIWKRKKIIAWVFLIAVIITAIVNYLFLPKVYEASLTLMINKPKYQVALEPKIQTLIATEVSVETYRILIQDRSLEEKVFEELIKINPSFKDLVPADLRDIIVIEEIKNTNLIELRVKSTSPIKAMQIVNTWAELFVKTNQELSLKETKEAQIFINEQLTVTEQNLDSVEKELSKFNEKNQISILEQEIIRNIEQIMRYQTQLEESTLSFKKKQEYLKIAILEYLNNYIKIVQKRIAEIDLYSLKKTTMLTQIQEQLKNRDAFIKPVKSDIDKDALDVITSNKRLNRQMVSRIGIDPIYFDLELQELDLSISKNVLIAERENLKEILVVFKELLKGAESKIESKDLTMDELIQLSNSVIRRISEKSVINEDKRLSETNEPNKSKIINGENNNEEFIINQGPISIYSTLEEKLVDTNISIKLLSAEIDHVKLMLSQITKEFNKNKIQLSGEKLKQTQLSRAISTINETYNVLSQKAEETRIAVATKPGIIKIVRPAYLPEDAIGPRKRRNVLIAGIISLTFGLFLAFVMQYYEPNKN